MVKPDTSHMSFRYLLLSFMVLLFNGLCAQSIGDYAHECNMRKSWVKNNISELDSIGILDDQAWTLKYIRSKGKFYNTDGRLNLQVPDSATLRIADQFYLGSFVGVDDGSGFHALYRIVLRSTEYNEHLESFIQFQVRKISRMHLVIDVFEMKRGRLHYGSRLVFANPRAGE